MKQQRMAFTPQNDREIRKECGLRLNYSQDFDDKPWLGTDEAWNKYIDILNELDPEVISNND
jgi:hypothetical protein